MSYIDARSKTKSNASGRSRMSVPARTHIASACSACRQRRCKCSGGLPCTRCKSTGTECTYNEIGDKRTKAARDRERGELGLMKKIVEAVFQAIRGTDQYNILPLIRQNAPLSAIAGALTQEMAAVEEADAEMQDDATGAQESTLSSLVDVTSYLSAIGPNESSKMHSDIAPNDLGPEHPKAEIRVQESLEATFSHHSTQTDQQSSRSGTSAHPNQRQMQPPLHFEDTSSLSYLSSLYVKFRDASSHIQFQDLPRSDGQWDDPVACDLLFRERNSTDLFTISTWAAAVVNNFPELDLYFRLAWLLLLTRFMRVHQSDIRQLTDPDSPEWSLLTNTEAFARLPELMQPTALQSSAAHPPFIDLVPLPQVRDALMRNPINFAVAFSAAGVSVCWDAALEAAVVYDSEQEKSFVSEEFERHVSQASNYRFGRRLLQFFPDLEGKVNLSTEEFIWPTVSLT